MGDRGRERPLTIEPSHEDWEPILLANEYIFAVFDGLNRFYVRASDRALVPVLARPISSVDDYIPYRQGREIARLRRELERARSEAPALVRAAYEVEVFGARVAASSPAARAACGGGGWRRTAAARELGALDTASSKAACLRRSGVPGRFRR